MSFRKLILLPESRYIKLTSNTLSEVEDDKSHFENRLDQSIILKAVPKNFRVRAEALLDHLSHANDLSWNKRGVLLYRGNLVPHSNISDLIRYCMREYTSFTPVGLNEYVKGLVLSNIPISLIGNRDLADRIHTLKSSDGESETDEVEEADEIVNQPEKSPPPPGARLKGTWVKY